MTIELIYINDCPNVPEARTHLLRAFAQAGLPPRWTEWEASDPDAPTYAKGYASPTILVDGKDVAGAEPSDEASSCRLYVDSSGAFSGVPAVEAIVAALRNAEKSRRGTWGWLAMLPGIGVAILPNLACPACWPVYAGLLSSLGLGFLLDASHLLPLTILFLLLAVGALGIRARRAGGYAPFAAGVLGAAVVVVGKFAFNSTVATYGGIALLVAASLWNTWLLKKKGSCPACAPTATASQETEAQNNNE